MIDPICGMEVEPSKAAGKRVYNGQSYYFCSHHCLEKLKEDPEKFLKSPASGHAAHGRGQPHEPVTARGPQLDKTEQGTYVCPMHPRCQGEQVRRSYSVVAPQIDRGAQSKLK